MSPNLEKGSIFAVIKLMDVGCLEVSSEKPAEFSWKQLKKGDKIEKKTKTKIKLRDAQTLIKLIKKWIRPGTTIISDFWKGWWISSQVYKYSLTSIGYSNLEAEGFGHLRVNHSLSFVAPDDPSIHTNHIECAWRHAKESFSTHGRVKHHVPGNLARYMFMKSVRAANEDPTLQFLAMAAHLYPGCGETDEMNEETEEGIDIEDVDIFDGE